MFYRGGNIMQNVNVKFDLGSKEKNLEAMNVFLTSRNEEFKKEIQRLEQENESLRKKLEKIERDRATESHNLWEFFEMLGRMGTVTFERR